MAKIQIREALVHRFEGKPPAGFKTWREFGASIELYSHINADLLYQSDSDPFHLTLPILEIGRVSENGLLYDEELVSAIEQQLPGMSGNRGHLTDEQFWHEYPLSAVFWVGHQRLGKITYAKGYVPPSPERDDLRRKVANGEQVRTSIYGEAYEEALENGAYRAREFELFYLDLTSLRRAALKVNGESVITRETEQRKGAAMPEIVTIAEVPEHVREQIIKQAQIEANARRVTELEQANAQLQQQIAEQRQYAAVVGEIRTLLGEDADVLTVVQQMYQTINALRETLGVEVDISVRVEELHTQMQEMQRQAFERAVSDVVVEMTDWKINTPDGQKKLDALRGAFRRQMLAHMGASQDAARVKEVAETVWGNDDFKVIAEAVKAALAGPAALVGGKRAPASIADRYTTDEARQKLRQTWGV